MIIGRNVTVYVSDMDRAVAFYVNQLGLKLANASGTTGPKSRLDRLSSSGCTRNPIKARRLAPAARCRLGSRSTSQSSKPFSV